AADHAAELLNKASRPVLVAGSKLRPPASREAFLKLADAAGYAVASVPAGKGMFPETHPAYAGIYWGPVSWPGVGSVSSRPMPTSSPERCCRITPRPAIPR